MAFTRLPEDEQWAKRKRCLDPQHDPPARVDPLVIKPGSYLWTCPACAGQRQVEVGHPVTALDGGHAGFTR